MIETETSPMHKKEEQHSTVLRSEEGMAANVWQTAMPLNTALFEGRSEIRKQKKEKKV